MAIAFRQFTQIASGGVSGASTISAATLPTGTTSGDIVILCVIVKYAGIGIITPTDWTTPTNNSAFNTGLTDSGNDAGNILVALLFREYDGVWAMPSITLTGAADVTMRGAISYSKGAGEAWVTPVCATAVDNSATTTGVDPGASPTTISFAAGDWFGSFCGVNGDAGTFSSHTATVSGVTFGTQNARLAAASTTGTDLRGHSVDKPYSSGTAGAGPDGNLVLTAGAATGAGVFAFYRLRVGTAVAATMASALGALTATISATVQHPTTVAAVLVAPLGTLTATGSATVVPRIEAALVATLGGLNATAIARRTLPATLAAPMGGLTATASGTVVPRIEAVLASNLGGLSATMAATVQAGGVTVNAVLVAPLGRVTATATATRQHPVTAVAACGGLAATATATVQHSALGAAPLASLVATMSATVTQAGVVDAVLVADLGALVAMANAGPPAPEPASVGFERFEGPSPAWGEVVSWVDALNEPMWEDFQV